MIINSMNKRIIIEQRVIATTDSGFEEESWQVVASCWAKTENLFGREYFAAAAVQAENTVKFTIRYITGLEQNMRISFKGKYFDIVHIDNIKYGNKFIEIKAMLREGE